VTSASARRFLSFAYTHKLLRGVEMDKREDQADIPYYQHTLKESFTCISRGLHTGFKIVMRVTPAEANTGIVFARRDVETNRCEIQANWRNVSDTRLSTTIANKHGVRVSTIEHLMAALYVCGIDNARIFVNGPEVPIMDGSASHFISLIKHAGRTSQDAERNALLVKQSVSVSNGNKFASFLPSPVPWIECEIDFEATAIGKQKCSVPISQNVFEMELAPARTFGFKEQINTLHKLGLAQGGSLQNAVLIEDDMVVNTEGLRFTDEFVRHKAVDSIGDLALVGVMIVGQFSSLRGGHELNNALIQKLMANEHTWEFTTLRQAKNYWNDILRQENADKDLARMIISKYDFLTE
jgi:UDP-3-O-[3-hydroxymyristoyl] N-acetylglucosamine deacetylase